MLRQARTADLGLCWRMVQDYAAEVAPPGGAPERCTVYQTLAALAASPRGYLAVVEAEAGAGLIAASVAPSPWAPVLVADYMIFWLDPALRGTRDRWALRMMDGYLAWARSAGARVAGASDTGRSLERLLARRGFAPAERKYLVEL